MTPLDCSGAGELERTLLAAARHGAGRNALFERFGTRIRAVARAHRLSAHDVDDVHQTTWLRLLELVGGIREPAALGAWLETTAQRRRPRSRCSTLFEAMRAG